MRLLYVTGELPWPIESGYLRHFHFLEGLARRHDVTLLSFTRRPAIDPAALDALRGVVGNVEVVAAEPARSAAGGAVARRRAVRRLARRAAELAAGERFDAVLSGVKSPPLLAAIGHLPLVVDVCDATSMRLRGELAVASPARAAVVAAHLVEVLSLERALVRRASSLLFASERDRRALVGDRDVGIVVPNGVDVEHFARSTPPATAPRIVFTGVIRYPPNHDAALRLVRDVLPRVRASIPEAEVVIAGRDPRPELLQVTRGIEGVRVTGALPDLRPELEASAVFCAPLRFAAGIQNKLLEAMALELPVVTTSVAAAGIAAPGAPAPVQTAEDDDALAAAIVALLGDPQARAQLGTAGRRHVAEHFSWARAVARVEGALERAARRRRGGFSVALIGCDGAGKTTITRALARDRELRARYLYMGVSADSSNRALPTTRLAHAVKRSRGTLPDAAERATPPSAAAGSPGGSPPSPLRRARRSVRSALRLGNRLADEWYRELLAAVYRRRGEIVLFDRHFFADFHAADVTARDRTLARRIHGALLARATPKPDLTIFLDAAPEVLYARKGEGTLESLARRREDYLRLATILPGYTVLSAERPLPEVLADVRAVITAYEPGA